jgi:hypothetical protein
MPSPYPLPKGCIFRERFENPLLAQRNGLVITGNPWRAKGVLVGAGMQILVPRIAPLKPRGVTIIANVNVLQFGGAYRKILDTVNGSNISIEVGLDNTSNKPFFYSSSLGSVALPSSSLQLGMRIVAWTSDGTNGVFYDNGVSLGGAVCTIDYRGSGPSMVSIGSGVVLNNMRFESNMFEILLFNYAMAQDEIQQYTRLLKGGLV